VPNYIIYNGMDVRGCVPRKYVIRDDGRKVITNIEEIAPLLKQRERELRRDGKI